MKAAKGRQSIGQKGFEARCQRLQHPMGWRTRSKKRSASCAKSERCGKHVGHVADRSRQLRHYRRWQRQQIKLHLAQPYDAEWRELARWLSRMTLDDGDTLVEYVRNARWLLDAGMAARQAALSVISGRIKRCG